MRPTYDRGANIHTKQAYILSHSISDGSQFQVSVTVHVSGFP